MRNFDNHITEQRRKKRAEESNQQDREDELARARKAHADQMSERGNLEAQLKVGSLPYPHD